MLKNQWYAVLEASQIQRTPQSVRRFGQDLVLWRDDSGAVKAAIDACPHRGAALSRGRVVGGRLVCPYHGLRFGRDGACVHIPAHPDGPIPPSMRLGMRPTRVAYGLVWVFHGDADPLPELPWDEAFEAELRQDGGVFIDLSDTFDVSYLRLMENLSDYHHVAHVHRHTAPVSAEITEFEAHREGRHVYVRGCLGKPGERGHMTATTHIVAPFLASLHFAGLARFATIATPIDDHSMWLFARYSQMAVHAPGLNRLLTWALGVFDYQLLQRRQDVPVWRSQRLGDPANIGRYTLLPADEGVRLYFQVHEELAG